MTYTLEDYLVSLHTGQWFEWSDYKIKVYSNLQLTNSFGVGYDVIDNPHTLPTEQECTDGVAALQTEYDSQQYARDRAKAYPSLQDQADMAYWDRQNGTTTLDDAIAAVKDTYPKD